MCIFYFIQINVTQHLHYGTQPQNEKKKWLYSLKISHLYFIKVVKNYSTGAATRL